jgi:hypothetical protein
MLKRKTTKRKSRRLPSWNEVRIGLSQASKLRLLFLLAKIYRSSVVPKSVKKSILNLARSSLTTKKVPAKRKLMNPKRGKAPRYFTKRVAKKPRSTAQKRAARKLVAFNRRRR